MQGFYLNSGTGSSRKLILQTALCNNIENEQYHQIDKAELAQGKTLESKYNSAIFKGSPTAFYNCHGMTFASRRTGIYEDAEIEKILKEDNYMEIKSLDDIMPGDIILYYEKGNLSHSGVVLEASRSLVVSVKILSKWGRYKEVIHDANHCPYGFHEKKYIRIQHGFKLI